MPLNETKELAQIVDETILPMEHSLSLYTHLTLPTIYSV